MGVKITDRQYTEIYSTEQTDWLLGNVGDWQNVTVDVEVSIDLLPSQQSPIIIDFVENSFTIADGTTWGEKGFDTGMTLTLTYDIEEDTTNDGNFNQVQSYSEQYLIANTFGDTIEVGQPILDRGFTNIPTNFGTRRIVNVKFEVDQEPQGVQIELGTITNNNFQTEQLNSVLDGTTTAFTFEDLENTPIGTFFNMESIGFQSGASVRMAKVMKLANTVPQTFTTFTIVNSTPDKLQISDGSGNPTYDTARPVAMLEGTPQTYTHTVSSQTIIPQSDGGDGIFTNGVFQHAFIRDIPTTSNHQFLIDFNFKVTDTERLRQNENRVQLILARYTNGNTMTIVEERVLRSWENCQSLVNTELNYRGFQDMPFNASDNLVLAVRFLHDRPFDDEDRVLRYEVLGGSIIMSLPNQVLEINEGRRYRFSFEYMISGIFDSVNNFPDNTPPTYLQGDKSLTDNFKVSFFPEWNNPNTVISNDLKKTARLGNTGWYNENYNELPNDFNIVSTTYENQNGVEVQALDYVQETKVKIVISGVPNINTNTRVKIGFAWIPNDENDYKSKTTPYYRNLFIQSGDISNAFNVGTFYDGPFFGAGINGGSIDCKDVSFVLEEGNLLCVFTLEPNTEFASIFEAKNENDRNYIIWVSVADSQKNRVFSDRVSLLADYRSLLKNIVPSGPYDMQTVFIEHPYNETDIGTTELKSISQDDVLFRAKLKQATAQNISFQNIRFVVEMKNTVTGLLYELESRNIDVSQSQTEANNLQVLNVDLSRGFNLPDLNDKNFIKAITDETQPNTLEKNYTLLYGFKMRYENWIEKQPFLSVFFDGSEELNGFNNNWVDYLDTENFIIQFSVYLEAIEAGEPKVYKNEYPFELKDYDKNPLINTAVRYIRDSDDTVLNIGTDPDNNDLPLGVILENESTRIEHDFVIQDAGVFEAGKVYADVTLEIDRGAGIEEMYIISSIYDTENTNPLRPTTGETRLKIELSADFKTAKTTCLVDADILEDAIKYRISGRVGCFDGNTTIIGGIFTAPFNNIFN